VYLLLPIQIFEVTSSIITFFHGLMIEQNWVKISSIISQSPEGFKKTIQKIWFARMMRRLLSLILRTPLRSKVLKLVNNKLILPEFGCVIAIPHTPWAKLLAEWCRSNNFALVFAGGLWIKRTGDVNVPGSGISGIRRIISHLNSKKFVVIIADNENRSHCNNVSYLGKDCNASLLPVQLAALARVSILTVIPKFQNKGVNLQNGLTIDADDIIENKQQALQYIFSYFENEIYATPSIYYPYILGSLDR
jgi:hypothetical protein